jgi:integrase
MASFFVKRGFLYFDFRWRGVRCQEATRRIDSPGNRVEMRRLVRQLDGELAAGTFDYAKWFPHGKRAARLTSPEPSGPPTYTVYVRRWLEDRKARLAPGTAYDLTRIVEAKLIPFFGARVVADIVEEDVEGFIAWLKSASVDAEAPSAVDVGATTRMRKRIRRKLGNRRVNMVLQALRLSLDRAVKRGWLDTNPARAVDRLREEKTEITPLSFDEVKALFAKGLQDEQHRRYFRVAVATGLRPGEQMGLRWDDIDWVAHKIAVRRAVGRFGSGPTKTVASRRHIDMLPAVEAALRAQRASTPERTAWVFPNQDGGPLNLTNFRERVWRPALRRAGLPYRALYQTRHTFATLMLAAGEDIGWVAKMLGHTSTEMVIRHYYRFIPNLTRRDGSAAARLFEEEGL